MKAAVILIAGMSAAALSPIGAQAKAYTPPRLADGAPDLNGIWQAPKGIDYNLESSLNGKNIIVDPPDGKIPYLPAAEAHRLENRKTRATADPAGKCFMPGTPRLMYFSYPFQIAQASDQLAVLSEFVRTVRHIYVRRQKHLPDIDFWMGDSIARWDGDTLIVDTSDFNDQTWLDGSGNYHSAALHVVERFRRTASDVISYEATIEDPQVFARPWTIRLPLMLHKEKDFQILDYECYALREGPTVTVGDKPDPHREAGHTGKKALSSRTGPTGGTIAAPPAQAEAVPPENSAGPIHRLRNGRPDLTGYWNARGRAGMYSIEKTDERKKQGIPAGPGLIIDPQDGKIPYQPWAREKEIDLSTNHMIEESDAHCYPSGFPHLSYAQFGYQIMQPPGYVIFIWEQMHAFRVIPLDGRPHIDRKLHQFMGDSRGRWQGDTLVVDITNQVARTWFDIAANFHSDQIHVVERFTPVDRNTIDYEATIDDSNVYTRPWKIGFPVDRSPVANYELLEYPCWEGERDLSLYTAEPRRTNK